MEFELRDFFFFAPSAGRAGGVSSDPDVRREASFIGKGLRVEMKASHAGMVNLNKVMYSPIGMDKSSVSWVFPQQRPVEIHHDDMADPVGRVIGAKFVPHGFHPEVQSDAAAIKEIFLDAHDTDSLFTAISLLEESGVLKEESWAGVGTLVLDCVITDSSAVEKILDGRYLGVSVSQHPKEAFCSICRKDWIKEGPCEHERGKVDEETGKEMYLVVGETRYKEVSYVNHPADEHATGDAQNVIDFISLEDSLQTKIEGARVLENPVYTLIDSAEIASLFSPVSEEPLEESLPLEQDEEPAGEIKETPVGEEEAATDEVVLTLEEALRVLFEDEDNLTEEMVELINEALEEDVKDADAKLTTEKRKRLAQKAFCGPGRSFPVPDCAHYTSALRLLGRYKGPGDKGKIRSCIESKGKKLGCSSEKKDYDEEVITSLIAQVQDLENEGLLVLGMTILDMAEELNIKVPCPNCRKMKAKLEEVSVSSLIKELKESWKQDKEVLPIEKLISDDPISLEASEETELDVEVSIDEEVHLDGEDAIVQEEVEEPTPETDGMANIPEGVVTIADAEGEVDEIIPQKLVDDLKTFYRKFGEAYVIDYFIALQTTGKISKDLALAKVLNLVR